MAAANQAMSDLQGRAEQKHARSEPQSQGISPWRTRGFAVGWDPMWRITPNSKVETRLEYELRGKRSAIPKFSILTDGLAENRSSRTLES
jgi:hypothetical protein